MTARAAHVFHGRASHGRFLILFHAKTARMNLHTRLTPHALCDTHNLTGTANAPLEQLRDFRPTSVSVAGNTRQQAHGFSREPMSLRDLFGLRCLETV